MSRSETREDVAAPPEELDGEPSPLGAAATLPGIRRRERREAMREARQALEDRDAEAPIEPLEGGSGVVHVYEPRTGSPTPLPQYLRELWARRQFLVALAKSDLRGSRSSTVLGSIWALLDPLFQAAIYFFLFTIIRGGEGGRPIEFLPLLVGGIFLFNLSTSAMNQGGKSIRQGSSLMLSSSFPRALLPLSTIYNAVLQFIPSIVVFAGVLFWLGAGFHVNLLWAPVLFSLQMILGIGMALAMSTLLVFFRDVEKAMKYVTRLFFFTTPVIYPVTLLPDDIRSVLVFQPLFSIFANYQRIFRGDGIDTGLMAFGVVWAFSFLVFGLWIFRRYEQEMASRL